MKAKAKFTKKLKLKKEKTILEAAKDLNIKIKAPCSAKGKCGKCVVKVLNGDVSELSKAEKKLLSDKKLDKGYRLACEAKIVGDIEVELID